MKSTIVIFLIIVMTVLEILAGHCDGHYQVSSMGTLVVIIDMIFTLQLWAIRVLLEGFCGVYG